jgi:hypothetical protein
MRDEMIRGLMTISHSVTLLELSIVGLAARPPVHYDKIYALGFYYPEPLYKIGYVMARAIVEHEDPQALAMFLSRPGYAFAAHYLSLPKYGQDEKHPKLDPYVVAALKRLTMGCRKPA